MYVALSLSATPLVYYIPLTPTPLTPPWPAGSQATERGTTPLTIFPDQYCKLLEPSPSPASLPPPMHLILPLPLPHWLCPSHDYHTPFPSQLHTGQPHGSDTWILHMGSTHGSDTWGRNMDPTHRFDTQVRPTGPTHPLADPGTQLHPSCVSRLPTTHPTRSLCQALSYTRVWSLSLSL